jgi:hypothetical protein
MISINSLRKRTSGFVVNAGVLDPGVPTKLPRFGEHRHSPEACAAEGVRWSTNGNMRWATTQDWM